MTVNELIAELQRIVEEYPEAGIYEVAHLQDGQSSIINSAHAGADNPNVFCMQKPCLAIACYKSYLKNCELTNECSSYTGQKITPIVILR